MDLFQLAFLKAYIRKHSGGGSGGDGGTTDHRQLSHRSSDDAHPMSAITGLIAALEGKMSSDVSIPTESTVSGWGFTKNTGTYTKPTGGIPESDLTTSVQSAIALARTAIQEHQSLSAYRTAADQDAIDNDKQPKSIDDTAGYFTDDTVEGALAELGAAKLSPSDKTNGMTQAVGKDENGGLWTEPSGSGGGLTPQVTVTTRPAATVTVESGDYTETYTVGESGAITIDLPDYGDYVITATAYGKENAAELTVDTVKQYTAKLPIAAPVYGVEWNRVASPVWTRTDDAALFVDPVPYVNNGMTADDCSSPFDDILPWSGMVRVTDPNAGELVAIPKFYYKWTNTADKMKLQITSEPQEGFHVSPAHMDRGDGHGERDIVYVGRYHCSTANYKSETGVKPKANITRADARTGIHGLGADIWQIDHAMRWTIEMLYLVEFANANSQAMIGYGCSNDGSTQNMGYTDSMPYHTGTMAASKTTYGASTQYRYIEGLWDNVYDWCDGIYFSGANVYHIANPADFSDSTGGTLTGTRATSSGVISGFTFPSVEGFEWAGYPASSDVAASSATYDDYFCDREYYNSSGVVLYVGGYYSQYRNSGLFFRYGGNTASSSYAGLGSRLQRLP